MKRALPVAVCTSCGRFSRDMAVINQACNRVLGDRKCKGVFRSFLQEGDWKECEACGGVGCGACREEGYLLVGRR